MLYVIIIGVSNTFIVNWALFNTVSVCVVHIL